MSTTINTLAYLGLKEPNPPNRWFRNRNPLTSDYQLYDLMDLWENITNQNVYILTSKAMNIATWQQFVPAGVVTVETLTGDVGAAVIPVANNINLQGGASGAVQFSNGGAGQMNVTVLVDNSTVKIVGNQLTAVSGAVIQWIDVTVNTLTVANTGYVANGAGLIDLTLPAVAPEGTIVRISGKGAGLYRAVANAGQVIHLGSSTTAVAGNLTATDRRDSVELLCTTANTEWNVLSVIGNLTVN